MRKILQSSATAGAVHIAGTAVEIHVEADAQFDEQTSLLHMTIETFSKPHQSKERLFAAGLELPCAQSIREHVSLEEALDVAKELFHQATSKVRQMIHPAFQTQD